MATKKWHHVSLRTNAFEHKIASITYKPSLYRSLNGGKNKPSIVITFFLIEVFYRNQQFVFDELYAFEVNLLWSLPFFTSTEKGSTLPIVY